MTTKIPSITYNWEEYVLGNEYTAGTGISINQNNEISNTLPWAVVSATAPSNPSQWDMWYDTTTDTLNTYDGTQWNWAGWGWDVLVSDQPNNTLQSWLKLRAWTESDYGDLSDYDVNSIYYVY